MKLELEKKSSRDFIYKQSLAIAAYELPYHPYPVIFFYEKNIDVSRKIFTIRPTFVSFSIFIEEFFPFLSPFFFRKFIHKTSTFRLKSLFLFESNDRWSENSNQFSSIRFKVQDR